MINNNLVLVKSEQYELLDSGDARKLERFGQYTLIRPEKQAMWKVSKPELWNNVDAEYIRSNEKFGEWKIISNMPREWIFKHNSMSMMLRLTPFGHTGIFPEQSEQWAFIQDVILNHISNHSTVQPLNHPKILSLFSYTGAATLAAAAAGAEVTHVDASKPAITWAVENQKLSQLDNKPIRWIVDDALKFVKREERRGNKYDGIIMDPPKFGRGPKGEVWQFEKDFPELLESAARIFSNTPVFFLVTAYAVPISPITLGNMLQNYLSSENIEYGELTIEDSAKKLLPTALYTRWKA